MWQLDGRVLARRVLRHGAARGTQRGRNAEKSVRTACGNPRRDRSRTKGTEGTGELQLAQRGAAHWQQRHWVLTDGG